MPGVSKDNSDGHTGKLNDMNTMAIPKLRSSLRDLFTGGCLMRPDISSEIYHGDRSCVSASAPV